MALVLNTIKTLSFALSLLTGACSAVVGWLAAVSGAANRAIKKADASIRAARVDAAVGLRKIGKGRDVPGLRQPNISSRTPLVAKKTEAPPTDERVGELVRVYSLPGLIGGAALRGSWRFGGAAESTVLDVDGSLPQRLGGDAAMLRQKLDNLLDDVAKLSAPLTADNRVNITLRVRCDREHNTVRVSATAFAPAKITRSIDVIQSFVDGDMISQKMVRRLTAIGRNSAAYREPPQPAPLPALTATAPAFSYPQ